MNKLIVVHSRNGKKHISRPVSDFVQQHILTLGAQNAGQLLKFYESNV